VLERRRGFDNNPGKADANGFGAKDGDEGETIVGEESETEAGIAARAGV